MTLSYAAFVALLLVAYYALPPRHRWVSLLVGSLVFYWLALGADKTLFLAFLASTLPGYVGARLMGRERQTKAGAIVVASIALTLSPLLLLRAREFVSNTILHVSAQGIVAPLGLSFYALQVVSYLVDVWKGRVTSQTSYPRYLLFVSFFPQIVQGPIPRYADLGEQLYRGHRFVYDRLARGALAVLWGLFLKMMIADKAAIVVNAIYAGWQGWEGTYFWVAGALYGLQLYADFSSCVWMSLGVAEMFGIRLTNNFDSPYLSLSVGEFWRRWHISLSSWLRDYVYIPLGGNRRGMVRKWVNLMATFFVSGWWHGGTLQYVLWGAMHGVFSVAEDMAHRLGGRLPDSAAVTTLRRVHDWRPLRRAWLLMRVTAAWVVFRAPSMMVGLHMLRSMFVTWNPWIFLDDSLLGLGLGWKQWLVLGASGGCLLAVSLARQRFSLRNSLLAMPLPVRWLIILVGIVSIWVFGTYGFGFDARDFIYGGF